MPNQNESLEDLVSLRPLETTDLDIIFTQEQDSEAQQMAAFTPEKPDDRAAFDAHWARVLANEAIIKRTILYDGEIAGHLAKFVMFEQPQVTYWLGREYWGRGVATQALKLFLDEYGERPLYGRCAHDNLASIRVLEKCGFVQVGTDRGFANARGGEIEEVIMQLD